MHLVELVPRAPKIFLHEAETVISRYPDIDGINIPDVLRLDTRSHTAATWLLEKGICGIPHIRTIDQPLDKLDHIIAPLIDAGLSHILLVSGDPNPDVPSYPITPIHSIKHLKTTWPHLKVYGAVDPYRQSFESEIAYTKEKIEAGADGVFSQPFFDPILAKHYLDALKDTEFFLGISPVLTDKSMTYWKTRNKVTFPQSFTPTMSHNLTIGRELIALANDQNQHTYTMPIKAPLLDYLDGLFSPILPTT